MANVTFYVLKGQGELARRQFACRLTEKAYRLSHKVHIRTADLQTTAQLDEMLWTFRDGSFVPHETVRRGQESAASPVTIGEDAGPLAGAAELLINLGDDIPDAGDTSTRIAEIVTSDDEGRRQSRARYARYRDLGHTLETHKL